MYSMSYMWQQKQNSPFIEKEHRNINEPLTQDELSADNLPDNKQADGRTLKDVKHKNRNLCQKWTGVSEILDKH